MKKKNLIALVVAVILWALLGILIYQLFTKTFENPVIASLPKYESSDCYYSGGFQDYTDYCKYYFSENDDIGGKLKDNEYFKLTKPEDVAEVKSYFKNFEGWVESENYKDKYDFEYEYVDTADYFYIENKDTYEKFKDYPDKYSAYNVYFFDVQTNTLYYIHSNI